MTRNEVLEQLNITEGFNTVPFKMSESLLEFKKDMDGISLQLDDDRYLLTKEAFTKASRICGVPETYVNKFDPEHLHLMIPHLNYWFNNFDKEGKLLLKGDNVVSFIPGTADYYSRVKLLELTEEALAGTQEEKGTLLYDKVHNSIDKGTYFSVVSNRQKFIKEGDLVRGGVQIQDHVLGEKPLVITAYVWRQVCSNGMISQDSIQKWSRRGKLENMTEWFKGAVAEAHSLVDEEFSKIHRLTEIPVENHGADILRNLFNEFHVAPRVREIITDNVVNDGGDTMYDIFNAFTAAANMEEFSQNPTLIRNIQLLGGNILAHSDFCPSCHNILGHKTV